MLIRRLKRSWDLAAYRDATRCKSHGVKAVMGAVDRVTDVYTQVPYLRI